MPVRASPARFPRWITTRCDSYNLREVGPNLYVGAEYAPAGLPLGTFDTIVDFYGSSGREIMHPSLKAAYARARRVVRLPFDDGDTFPDGALDVVWAALRDAKGPALLHCQAGLSRSASAAYAVMRRLYGLDHETARSLVTVRADYPREATLASARRWVAQSRERVYPRVGAERRA